LVIYDGGLYIAQACAHYAISIVIYWWWWQWWIW